MRKNFLYLVIAILTLPLVIVAQQQIQRLLSLASPQPANIVIDTQNTMGPIVNNWAAFAQGGEEPPPMLKAAVPKLKELAPRFIRLDHIYDSYNVVKRKDNGFEYDFKELDKTVDDIIVAGALPFLSLTYMPSVFTSSGSVIDLPTDWNYWKDLIRATIEHYSGKNNRNLIGVYYEVWNEPELPQFGGFKIGSDKDYRLLYFHAARAAGEASNVNSFFFGGPAVGSYYPNWVDNFVSYVSQNNLRLDFYSWHRYTKKPQEYISDASKIRQKLSSFPKFANLPLIITEWGIESENNPINNTNQAAAFTVSSLIQFQDDINLSFAFEVKDGPPPAGGKWGLITHEKDSTPLSPKPRYYAFSAFNELKGEKLKLSGNGSFVNALSAKSEKGITVILANYDPSGKNTENVPVTFTGLSPSSYNLKYTYILSKDSGNYQLISSNGTLSKTFIMQPNTILLLELSTDAPLASFVSGTSGQKGDQALALVANSNPLVFHSPGFWLRPSGSVSFDLKPLWGKNDNRSFIIFEAPFATSSAQINRLFLAKQKKETGNMLTFGVTSNKEEATVTVPIDSWQPDKWHHIETGWDPSFLSLSIDGNLSTNQVSLDIRNGSVLTFYPIEATIDNLKITLGGQVIERKFDGYIDK